MTQPATRQLIAEAFRLHRTGRIADALPLYAQALAREPNNFDALSLSGTAALQMGDITAAVTTLQRALTVNQRMGTGRDQRERLCDTYANLATALEQQRQFDAALAVANKALAMRPNDAVLLANTANLHKELGQWRDAEAMTRKALALNPQLASAWARLAQLLVIAGQRDDALQAANQARSLAPTDPTYLVLHGILLVEAGDIEQAMQRFDEALVIAPTYSDALYNRAVLYIGRGQLALGWRDYCRHHPRWRQLMSHADVLPPRLDGQAIFLRRNQGLGDELFFLRFAALLKARGAHITYCTDPKLHSLVSRLPFLDAVVTDEQTPVGTHFSTLVDLLPFFLQAGDADLPRSFALAPRHEAIQRMAIRLAQAGPPPYLAVTWRAGMQTQDLDYRDIVTTVLVKQMAPELLGELVRDWPGTILILQRKPTEEELQRFCGAVGKPVHDFSDLNQDLEDMLALLAMIERYAAVSNTNLHLRAAVGLPTHVLVPNPPELRWGFTGRSPWFPDCPVYRQTPDGEWHEARDHLLKDLLR